MVDDFDAMGREKLDLVLVDGARVWRDKQDTARLKHRESRQERLRRRNHRTACRFAQTNSKVAADSRSDGRCRRAMKTDDVELGGGEDLRGASQLGSLRHQ